MYTAMGRCACGVGLETLVLFVFATEEIVWSGWYFKVLLEEWIEAPGFQTLYLSRNAYFVKY